MEDSCAIGVPNEEWGEEVKVVVTLHPGQAPSEALARADILSFARQRLARGFKIPRSVDFVRGTPPPAPPAKIQRGKVRGALLEPGPRECRFS